MKGTFEISLLSQEEIEKQFPTGGSFMQQSRASLVKSAIEGNFSFAKVTSKHTISRTPVESENISNALIAHLGGEPLTIWRIGQPDYYSVYLAYKKTSEIIELF